MKRIISFGEVLWDLFPEGKELGGAPANFAFRIHSLGLSAWLVSRVGDDELGREAVNRLRQSGFSTEFIQVHPKLATGTVEIKVSELGEPDFQIVPGVAYDEIEFGDELERAVREADCIYFGTLAQRAAKSRETLGRLLASAPANAARVLDLNLRRNCYTRESVEHSLAHASILKLNEEEAAELAVWFDLPKAGAEFARRICEDWKLTHCLITRGENGVYARTAEGEECALAGVRVKVIDTCGAGDAFTAGVVSQMLEGAGLERCCRFGNALGALVAGSRGATTPISRKQVEEVMVGPAR